MYLYPNPYSHNRRFSPTDFERDHRYKIGVLLGLSLLFLFLFMVQIDSNNSPFWSHTPFKVLQLDVEKDVRLETQGLWNFTGWKYFKTLDPVVSTYHLAAAEDIQARREGDPNESKGFWVLGSTRNGGGDGDVDNAIQLSGFQYEDPQKLSLGISFFLEGTVELEIRFWFGGEAKTSTIYTFKPEGMFFNYGICTEIINISCDCVVDEIEIEAFMKSKNAFAAIDKVVVIIGEMDEIRNLMYTMLPSDWCHETGKQHHSV